MKQQAPPRTAGPEGQWNTIKTMYGPAGVFAVLFSALLFPPATLGLLAFLITAIICSLNSTELAETSLVRSTKLKPAYKL